MVFPFFGLAVALQTVALIVENLGYFGMADGMPAPGQGSGNGARIFAGLTQRRLGIASRLGIDHRLQPRHQFGIGVGNRLAAASRPADTTFPRHPGFNFLNSFTDCLAEQAARPIDETHASRQFLGDGWCCLLKISTWNRRPSPSKESPTRERCTFLYRSSECDLLRDFGRLSPP